MQETDENELLIGARNQLRWSLQALAMGAEVQRSLFPDFVCKAEELAFDFDHWLWFARSEFGAEFSGDQAEALRAIDRRLNAMSYGGIDFDEELWSEAALGTRPEWEEVRSLAKLTLARFGWAAEVPPRGRSMYVCSDKVE